MASLEHEPTLSETATEGKPVNVHVVTSAVNEKKSSPLMSPKSKAQALSYDYNYGDVVWAKLKGFPIWPAVVVDPETEPELKKVPHPSSNYAVYFLGTHNYQWISKIDMLPYNEFFAKNKSASATHHFKLALEEAQLPESIVRNPFYFKTDYESLADDSGSLEPHGKKTPTKKKKSPPTSENDFHDSDFDSNSEEEVKSNGKKKITTKGTEKSKKYKNKSESPVVDKTSLLQGPDGEEAPLPSKTAKNSKKETGKKTPVQKEKLILKLPSSENKEKTPKESNNKENQSLPTPQDNKKHVDQDKLFRYRYTLQKSCLGNTIDFDSLKIADDLIGKLMRAKVSYDDLVKTKIGNVIKKISKTAVLDDEDTLFIARKAQQLMDHWTTLFNFHGDKGHTGDQTAANEAQSSQG